MKRKYLGDSYDAVKRMWQDMLNGWAKLYADPIFIPGTLQNDFTRLTRIPILSEIPTGAFSILNDPDTGIRLPGEKNQSKGSTHVTIDHIIDQLQNGAKCVVTYDQSDYRNRGMKREEQRKAKMKSLADREIHSFYYVSHAPFLFAVKNARDFSELMEILNSAGIPQTRLEPLTTQ